MKKQNEKLHHSHDKLFKTAFQIKQTVIDFLLNFFPKELTALLDLDALELDNTNYISSVLDEYYSDVVYKTKLKGRDTRLILLFEHKKSINRSLYIQLLEYMIAIWRSDLQAKRPFTIIIPIVVYQGQGVFKPKPFFKYFPDLPEELRRFVPHFDYLLTGIKKIGDNIILDLNDSSVLRALFLAFKYTHDTHFISENFKEFFKFYLQNPHLKDFSNQILVYLYHNSDITKVILRDLVDELPSQLKDESMTTYSRIKLEGKLENVTFVIKRGWAKGYSIEALADLTGLSVTEVKDIIKKIEEDSTQISESKKDKN